MRRLGTVGMAAMFVVNVNVIVVVSMIMTVVMVMIMSGNAMVVIVMVVRMMVVTMFKRGGIRQHQRGLRSGSAINCV